MFDHHNGIAALHQLVQDLCQLLHICKMQAGGGLVQNIDGLAGALAGELRCQLDSLCLAAGKLRRRLPQSDIAQSHVIEGLDLIADPRHIFKEAHSLFHRHIQHIVNALSFVFDLQCLPVVASAVADLAGHVHIRQEMHFDLDNAVAAAGLTSSSLYIKGKTSLCIASGLCIRCGGKKLPDHIKHAGIGGRIGARRPPDGGLIDIDDLIQLLHALYAVMCTGHHSGSVQGLCQRFIKHFIDQRTLAGAGDAGDCGHNTQGKGNIDVL